MILFWTLAGLMGLLAALILIWPLFRTQDEVVGEREAAIAVLRDQLRELERDSESGRIGPEEARAARVEIERRALAADKLSSGSGEAGGWLKGLVAGAGIVTPVLAFWLYLDLGSPNLATRSNSEQSTASNVPGDMADRTEVLAQRLSQEGGSFEDWWLLAQSYMFMQQPAQAADALEKAAELNDDPAVKAAWAEMLIQSNGGVVTPDSEKLLGEVLAADPQDPRARYYKGLAAAQAQFFDDALTIWQDLLADTPDDAPWLNAVVQAIRDVANAAGRDPEPMLAGRQATGQPDVAELRARLQNEPRDYQGWLALAEAEVRDGNDDAAREAIARVRSEYEGAPFVQQQISQAEAALGLAPQLSLPRRGPSQEDIEAAQEMSPDEQREMIRGMVGGLAERLESQPDDREGWMMLIRSYAVLGDREAGLEAYDRARAQFVEDSSFLSALEEQARIAGIVE